MRKAGARIIGKIRQIVRNFHQKLANFLCTNCLVILLLKFAPSKMTRRGQRKFRSKITRALAAWSRDLFLQRLVQKSREYPWCRLIIANESYKKHAAFVYK